jgi:polar amino acid transport system substrate-binding protein
MRHSILLITICLLLAFQTISFGGETEIKRINFAEEADWPPFTLEKSGIATEGLSIDLMQEIFSRLGIDVEVELLPQKRMIEYLKTGRKDGATVISKNAERLTYLDYTDTIFLKRGLIYFLTEKNPPFDWKDYEDLKGLRIGIVAGHNYGDRFSQAIEKYNLNIQQITRIEQNFDKLLSKRIDVFLCIELTAKQFLRNPKYKGKISHAPKSYYSKGYHIGFSKKSKMKVLIPIVNKVIREMKKDGSLRNIISQHTD